MFIEREQPSKAVKRKRPSDEINGVLEREQPSKKAKGLQPSDDFKGLFGQVNEELLQVGGIMWNKLPSGFEGYLPTFRERFESALESSPMDMLFLDNSARWRTRYSTTLNNVDNVCADEHVCGHGADHVSHVAQNAFTLADTIPSEDKGGISSDANLALAALTHDLGYASEEVNWKNFEALGHDRESANWLKSHKRKLIYDSEPFNNSESVFYKTIELNNKGYIREFLQEFKGNPTSEDIFMLTIFLADKLDYFRAERVRAKGVEVPVNYEDNPYFFQADAVERYEITSDDSSIYYNVKIKERDDISKKDGSKKKVDFGWWKEEIEKNSRWIFDLGERFAGISGKNFVVRELTTELEIKK